MTDIAPPPAGKPSALFISYRRADTRVFARDLHKHLAVGFGYDRVFMDRAEIRAGQRWAERLDEELARSTVVLALIGPSWLNLQDADRRRRIDNPRDWVRRELSTALATGKEVIPIYVGGAEAINDPKKLPDDLAGLPGRQRVELNEASWNSDMARLVRRLEELGLRATRPDFRLPARLKRVAPLSSQEIEAALAQLPHWTLTGEERWVPHAAGPVPHSELYREYAFNQFEEATAFMAQTSAEINRRQHHPRWENFWNTVRVWLSPWDIEFHPSSHDVELAKWLDQAYRDFTARPKGTAIGAPIGTPMKADDPPASETPAVSTAPTAPIRLPDAEVERRLSSHPGWALMAGKLERTLRFADFQSAFGFMASVALAAEAMNHHPAWFNDHDTVRIQLATLDVGGISELDFRLVARIDALATRQGGR